MEIFGYFLICILVFLLVIFPGITRIKPYILEKIKEKEAIAVGISLSARRKRLNPSVEHYTLAELRAAWFLFNDKHRFDYRKKVRARRELIKKAIQAKLKDERK